MRNRNGGIKMAYSNPIPNIIDDSMPHTEQEPDYKQIDEVYFAFIDVLGFKKTFDDIKISNKPDTADKYRNVFNYYFALMNSSKLMESGKDTGCYAGQTSDSLYFYTSRTDYLLQFIKIFSHFSLYAMSQDVFFRGGIAKGSLFKKKDYQFFGDSVIGAYLLESNISKNPIIVIDEKTHEDMCKQAGYCDFVTQKSNRNYIKPFKLLHENVALDIIDGFVTKSIDKEQIEKNITMNKAAFEYDANNYGKYGFLMEEFISSNKASLADVK